MHELLTSGLVILNKLYPVFLRSVGFDIPRGGLILSRGDFLGPAELGLLATAGVTKVNDPHVNLVRKTYILCSTDDSYDLLNMSDCLHPMPAYFQNGAKCDSQY